MQFLDLLDELAAVQKLQRFELSVLRHVPRWLGISAPKQRRFDSSRHLSGLLSCADGRILDADNHHEIKIWLLAPHTLPLDSHLGPLPGFSAHSPRETEPR